MQITESLVIVGDLTDKNFTEDDKPLDSIALAKFLSKAAMVTRLHVFCETLIATLLLLLMVNAEC